MFSSSSAPLAANLGRSTGTWWGEHVGMQWHHTNQHAQRGGVHLPAMITCSQSSLKCCTNKSIPNYLAASRLCWSCWSGSMCCRWRPLCVRGTPLTLNLLLDLRPPTVTPLQCQRLLPHRHILAFSLWVHNKRVVAVWQFAQTIAASCLELTRLLDQGTPGPPPDNRDNIDRGRTSAYRERAVKNVFTAFYILFSTLVIYIREIKGQFCIIDRRKVIQSMWNSCHCFYGAVSYHTSSYCIF